MDCSTGEQVPALVSFKDIRMRKYAVGTANALQDMRSVLNNTQSTGQDIYNAMRSLLEQLTLMLLPESPDFDMWLTNILHLWTQCPRGWYVLITSMCVDLRKEEKDKQKAISELFKKFITWIIRQHKAYGHQCGVWELSPALLANLCGYNDDFAKWYIKRLCKMGDHLNTRLQKSLVLRTENPLSEVDLPELKELQDRLGQLVMKGDTLKASTMHMVVDRKSRDGCSVWNSICLQLYKKYREQ